MKNTFIVEVESAEGTIAKGLAEAFDRGWSLGDRWRLRPSFKVEEYDYKKIAGFVSDYLAAEDELSKYEAEHDLYANKVVLDSPIARRWRSLYDDVRAKRAFLVDKLRKHGCIVQAQLKV